MRSIAILLLLLAPTLANAQTVLVKSFEAIEAKSAQLLTMPESVAVILTERQPGVKTGAFLNVSSDRKWATPVYDGIDIKETEKPGEWIMFAPPGKYRVLLAEVDPELRPRYSWHNVVIDKPSQPPTEPTDPPPTGDFAALTKIAKESADALNDPKTRAALASGYKATLTLIAGKPYDEAIDTVQKARRMVLQANMRGSSADWNGWLKAVDAELGKVVPAGDAAKYVQAVEAIAKGLEAR